MAKLLLLLSCQSCTGPPANAAAGTAEELEGLHCRADGLTLGSDPPLSGQWMSRAGNEVWDGSS